ncbi:MAG: hypothetical protein ACLTE2_02400 [Eubacteriales bacterium]
MVSITEYITLSCIIADDTLNGMEQLTNMQLGVLNLLRQGYLSVSDRSISCSGRYRRTGEKTVLT